MKNIRHSGHSHTVTAHAQSISTSQIVSKAGGGEAAASDGEGCVDDDALAAERASAFGISISGCKRGKVMGLCAYPEGSGACPVTCGTCGQ